jgi:hypothetical protein
MQNTNKPDQNADEVENMKREFINKNSTFV